ncbi:FkbM family methyltransferase [Caenispirillum bisanense]|uniref:FkbM family methyltransferase n=1 Tax=Caenispirillum bisanense TaxID=414052 RepID=UPI0031D3B9F7
MGIISYAQNFEDVILWRAVGDIPDGCYIDIGAWHPVIDSVSKAFYEHGWRGIHVEPATEYVNLLRADRPDETVIQAVVSDRPGIIQFYEIPDSGLSTARKDIALEHQAKLGYEVVETPVTAITLDSLLALAPSDDIHWLKIDVEGFEREVLSGWRESPRRPWIIVVEATYPNTQSDTYADWEPLILDKNYRLVYRDGLNRFYLHEQHPELGERFIYPPNVFDGFQLSGTGTSMTSWLVHNHQQVVAQLETKLAAAESKFRDAEKTANEMRFQATKQEAALREELNALRLALERTREEATEREQSLRAESAQALAETQREAQAQLRGLLEREQELAEHLLEQQKQSHQATLEQARAHAEREAALEEELKALRAALERARDEAAERERELQMHAQQAVDRTRREIESHLKQWAAREREFAEELARLHAQASQAREAAERAHAVREAALEEELKTLREALERAREEAAERERSLRAESEQALAEAQREAQAQLRGLLEREQELAEHLLEQQRQSQQAAIEQTRAHVEREAALEEELKALRAALERARDEAAERERELQMHAQQAVDRTRREIESHLKQWAAREREFAEELARLHAQASQAREAAERAHAVREAAFEEELKTLREALERAREEATAREQTLREASECALDNVRREAQATLQALLEREHELQARLLAEQQTRHSIELRLAEKTHLLNMAIEQKTRLDAELAFHTEQSRKLADELARIHQSYAWRLTLPLRRLGAWLAPRHRRDASTPDSALLVGDGFPAPRAKVWPGDDATPKTGPLPVPAEPEKEQQQIGTPAMNDER